MRRGLLVPVLIALLLVTAYLLSGCGGGGIEATNDGGAMSAAAVSPTAPGATGQAGDNANDGLQPYLIGFKRAPGAAEEALLKGKGGRIKYNFHLIPAIAARLPAQAIQGLRKNPKISYIEADAEAQASEDTVPWGISRVKADQVWPNVAAGVKIAIIDTGIDHGHADLAPNYAGGYDFVNGDADPMDDHGHGTHVSGTAAAAANEADVVGVAPGAALYGLKVLSASGSGSYSNIIAALQWCYDNGMQIASMSLGGSKGSIALKSACDKAYERVLLVAAAGNSGNPRGKGDNVGYPAKYASVIAVAATNSSDQRASFSSTGSAVELAAPGVGVESDRLGGGTISYNGTSMACPHVSGAAALVIASGVSDPASVRQRLNSTATDLGTKGRDVLYGYGLLNAAGAAGVTVLAAR